MARFQGTSSTNTAELGGKLPPTRIASCSVILAEDSRSQYRWELSVSATTRERGTIVLGKLLTIPPSWFAGLPGVTELRAPNRLVAIATCCAAVSYKVTGRAVEALEGQPLSQAVLDVTLGAIENPVGPDGLALVNADGSTPEIAQVTAGQIAIPAGVPTLIAPFDQYRTSLLVTNAGVGDLNVGPTPSLLVTDYVLISQAPFTTSSHRPLWAFSTVGTIASFMTERS